MKQRIESFLTEYGWAFDPGGDARLETGWKSVTKFFPVSISWTESEVTIEVSPLVLLTEAMLREKWIADFLMELNRELKFVRLWTDDDGGIHLRGELWSDAADYPAFERALSTVGYYAEQLYPRLLAEVHMALSSQPQTMLT